MTSNLFLISLRSYWSRLIGLWEWGQQRVYLCLRTLLSRAEGWFPLRLAVMSGIRHFYYYICLHLHNTKIFYSSQQIGNEKVTNTLGPLLKKLNDRRESHNFDNNKEVEYATGCAIKSLGPEFVLKTIPLRDGPENINIERTWVLPVLKEKIQNSNLKFFATEILEMATFCRKRSRELSQEKNVPLSHTYDLLCNQLWALLPSFCNCPKDIKENFKCMARVLGSVLKDNPEFRLSVMLALRKLITCSMENEDDRNELGRFAKNYLPILLNIYMSPTKGSSAEGQRLAALETIQVFIDFILCMLIHWFMTTLLNQYINSTINIFIHIFFSGWRVSFNMDIYKSYFGFLRNLRLRLW